MELYKRLRTGYRGAFLIESRFYACHPIIHLLYFIGYFGFLFLFSHPVFIITGLITTLMICFLYIEPARMKGALKAAASVGCFMILINPLVNHRGANILFYLFDNPITLEAFFYGVCSALTLCNLLLLFLPFNILLDSERFLYLFGRLSPKIAFITSLSLRYTGVLNKRAKEIADVQKSRGLSLSGGTTTDKVRIAGRLLGALCAYSLEEGMVVAEVLKAKEYGSGKRSRYAFFKLTSSGGLFLIIMLALFVVALILSACGAGGYAFYPRLSGWSFEGYAGAAYMVMVAFLWMPFAIELTR